MTSRAGSGGSDGLAGPGLPAAVESARSGLTGGHRRPPRVEAKNGAPGASLSLADCPTRVEPRKPRRPRRRVPSLLPGETVGIGEVLALAAFWRVAVVIGRPGAR